MSVIGNSPNPNDISVFKTVNKQSITGTGDSSYNLSYDVSVPEELEVFVNNVRQEPRVAYNIASGQITFDEGIDSTDDCYIIFQGSRLGTVEPGSNTITTAMLQNASITSKKLHDSQESLTLSGDLTVNSALNVTNTSTNYARIGTTTKGHFFESQSDSATDGFEIYQQHGSNTSRNSFIVNDNRTGSKSAAFAVRGDGAISTPSQPIGWRRNTNTTNGWVTMTSSQHYIWSSWYTSGNSWYGDSKADTIADNGRFTATHAGWYLVGHEGYISTGSSAQTAKYTYAYVYKNGSAHYSDGRIMGYGGDFNDKFYQNTNPVYLEAGDYIQCGLYNVGNGAQYYSPYCGYWVYYLG